MYKKKSNIFLLILAPLVVAQFLWAAQIKLKNEDSITGEVLMENEELIRLKHPTLGELEISKKDIQQIISSEESSQGVYAERRKGDLLVTRRIVFGYNITRGNTDTEAIHLEGLFNRNRLWIDEWTLQADFDLQTAGREDVYQRASGKVRYGFAFWEKFYNFYLVGAEHDRFENVKLRLTPTTGVGYWFSDTEEWKLMTEAGVGWEITYYRRGEPERGDAPISHLRGKFERKLNPYCLLGTDSYIFPYLDELDHYRIDAECYLRVSLSDSLALKLKSHDEYNSEPQAGLEKNDLRFITSLEYNF